MPIARNLQKKRAISAAMAKATIGRNRGGPRCRRLAIFLFSPFTVIAAGGGRLRHVDRIGGGETVLETLFERSLELALAGVLPLALALVVARLLHDGLLRNGHGCSPCKRRKSSRHRANNARRVPGVPLARIGDRQDQRPVIAF